MYCLFVSIYYHESRPRKLIPMEAFRLMKEAQAAFKTIDRLNEDNSSKLGRLHAMWCLVSSVIVRSETSITRRKKNNSPSEYSAAMVKMEKKQIKLIVSAKKLHEEIDVKEIELSDQHNKLT